MSRKKHRKDTTTTMWLQWLRGRAKKPDVRYTTTQYYVPKCAHDATKPVIIGGLPIWLGAERNITAAVVAKMDVILPLNGNIPEAYFGDAFQLIICGLKDQGGVPTTWRGFLDTVIAAMTRGDRCLAYCTGGHGRTGVFGASLIALLEPDVEDPIAAIRKRHCEDAVESSQQKEAVFALRGLPVPKEYIKLPLPLFKQPPQPYYYYQDGLGDSKPNRNHLVSCSCGNCSDALM